MKKHSVGFIGLGRMGFGMASNLAKAGVSLTVYDARPEPMEACVALGATLATDPADLASRVEHLFLCLPSETEVDDVLFGSQGVVTAVGNGLVISDTTTMNHGAALQLAEKSEKAGWSYSDRGNLRSDAVGDEIGIGRGQTRAGPDNSQFTQLRQRVFRAAHPGTQVRR
jgi:3-hydroxyisobutyrate dehydrogenase-like beta-hydroxyacid dehydrogenase